MDSDAFDVLIEPGGVALRVPRDANVLGVALAAGLPLPHSCRAGRCASCKSRLLSGRVEYPDGIPPGITPMEIARGEVLLCQARPRSDLRIETRRMPRAPGQIDVEYLGHERLAFGAVKVALRRVPDPAFAVRPGQFVDLDNLVGASDRVTAIAVQADTLSVELVDSALVDWFENAARPGDRLRMTGPFEGAR